MDELTALGIKYKTDKAFWHGYTEEYAKYFSPIRYKNVNILELGVAKGASLKMLEEYFPNAFVYGLDVNESRKYETDRIKIFHGSQSSQQDLEKILSDCMAFDMIIDDGSHYTNDQLFSFYFLFDYIRSDGLYICEDIDFDMAHPYSFMKLVKSYIDTGMIIHGWRNIEEENKICDMIKEVNIFSSKELPRLCSKCHSDNMRNLICDDCKTSGVIGTTCIIRKK